MSLLVPYTHPSLITRTDVASKASPFIIAIQDAGLIGLDSVMNATILVAVLSVANSSMYGSTRTLAALAEQGQAPKILAYIDRKGRPLVSIGIASAVGLLAYLNLSSIKGPAFTWLLALSGLSSIFTWCSICYAHIRFRSAWAMQGHQLSDLIYCSPLGSTGSWIGLSSCLLILVTQFWVAISPPGDTAQTAPEKVTNFFEAYLAMPIVMLFYAFYKICYKTTWARIKDIDLVTGRNKVESETFRDNMRTEQAMWPRWKVLYKTLC
jgi:yeast amino acid transporter